MTNITKKMKLAKALNIKNKHNKHSPPCPQFFKQITKKTTTESQNIKNQQKVNTKIYMDEKRREIWKKLS